MSSSTLKTPSDSKVITITLNPNGNIGGSQIPYIEGVGFGIIRKHQKSFPIGNGKYRNWIPKENTSAFVADMKKMAGLTVKLVAMTKEEQAGYEAKWGKSTPKPTKAEKDMSKSINKVASFAEKLTPAQKKQLGEILGL